MRTLVVNAGSSTLKLSVIDPGDQTVASVTVEPPGASDAIASIATDHSPVEAVGHRVVHGGARYTAATVIEDRVVDELANFSSLAPLHQPAALAAIAAARKALPGVPHVACFDTAFHATLPDAAATYALPEAWRKQYGLRRYGFHGLSHAWTARQADRMVSGPVSRLICCHLGSGSSLCAIRDGRSVDTTMGFTPLEGLVMATRAGTIDPGLVLWLIQSQGRDPADLAAALEHESGLAGLTGTAGDMRQLLDSSDPKAALALDVWAHSVRRHIGAMAAALGGVDTLVFTGGIGEHAQQARARAVEGLEFLGVELDASRNAVAFADADISGSGAGTRTLVITAREDLEVARQVVDRLRS